MQWGFGGGSVATQAPWRSRDQDRLDRNLVLHDCARPFEKVMLCSDQLLWRRAAGPAGRQTRRTGILCASEHLQDTPCGCWEAAYLSAGRRTGREHAAPAWPAVVAAMPQSAPGELPLGGCSALAAACLCVQMAVSMWPACVQPAGAPFVPDDLLVLQHLTGMWMAVSHQLDSPQGCTLQGAVKPRTVQPPVAWPALTSRSIPPGSVSCTHSSQLLRVTCVRPRPARRRQHQGSVQGVAVAPAAAAGCPARPLAGAALETCIQGID